MFDTYSDLENKLFDLKFKSRRNTSKFAIFIQKENPCFFPFFISSDFHFYLMNVLVFDNIDQLLKMKKKIHEVSV